jgi:hypothetical protein
LKLIDKSWPHWLADEQRDSLTLDDDKGSPHPVFARLWLRIKKPKIYFEILKQISHQTRHFVLFPPTH